MCSHKQYAITALAAAGTAGAMYYAYQLYQDSKRTKIPEEWTEVGTLSDLYVYPVKSCCPSKMNRAECTKLGLKDGWLRDRTLMVVDEKNNFITARAYPDLLTVKPTVKGSVITFTHIDMEPCSVNLAEVVALQTPKTARVWGIPVPVLDCGWEISEWFSRILTRSTSSHRLVYYASQSSRKDTRPFKSNMLKNLNNDDTGALPDEVPFNLINSASVDELNTRLKDLQVTHRNFRPNFVLSGGSAKAYDEDNWKFVKIGENVFEIIKPCTRCIMTTIDPETGVRNVNCEPLETLKSYRQLEDPEKRKTAGNSPRMGIQMVLRSAPGGFVNVNDPIYIA